MRVVRAGAGARSDSGTSHRSLATTARWVVLLVALAGLMAMHGLSDHGVSGVPGTGSDTGTGAAFPVSHSSGTGLRGDANSITASNHADQSGHHQGRVGLTGDARFPGPSSSELGTGSGGDRHGQHRGGHEGLMVGMCFAVLGALALLRTVRRGSRPLDRVLTASVDRALASATALRARRLGAVRPDLRMLSIQRC